MEERSKRWDYCDIFENNASTVQRQCNRMDDTFMTKLNMIHNLWQGDQNYSWVR